MQALCRSASKSRPAPAVASPPRGSREQLAPPVVAVMVVLNPGDWFDEVLDALAGQDYPNLKTLFLVAGRAGRPARADPQRLPDAFVRAVGNPGFRPRGQRGAPPGRGRQRLLLLPARRRRPRARRHPPAGRGAVPLERGHRRSEARRVGRPPRPAARRARRRPLRRDRPDRRAGRGRPGAARRRARRVRPAVGLPARPRRPVPRARRLRPGDRLLRRGRRPVLARPPRRRPGRGRAGSAGPPPRGAPRAAARSRARRCCRPATACASVATLTGARRLPLLLVQLLARHRSPSSSSACVTAPREAWPRVRALVGLVPRTPGFVARRREFAPCATSRPARSPACRCAAAPASRRTCASRDPARRRREHASGAGGRPPVRRRDRLVCVLVAARVRRPPSDRRRAPVRPVPAVPDSPGAAATTAPAGRATASARRRRHPRASRSSALASMVTLFHMGLLHTVAVLGLLVVGYAGMWRLASLFPTPRARIVGPRRLRGRTAARRAALESAGGARWPATRRRRGSCTCCAAAPGIESAPAPGPHRRGRRVVTTSGRRARAGAHLSPSSRCWSP